MNGLLRRLTRRRAATADETPPGTPAASEPVDATVVSFEEHSPLSEEEQAREEELRRRRRDLPAGVDPSQLEAPIGESARRGAVRRRVRYLRSVREVLLRDLGGFFYEIHRAAGAPHGEHRRLLETKAGRLAAIDEELARLENQLGEPHPAETVVRQPGVGGTCPACGELHGSDAGWCAHCGTALSDRARKRREQDLDRTIAERQARAAEQAREAQAAAGAANGEAATPRPDGDAPDGGSTRAAGARDGGAWAGGYGSGAAAVAASPSGTPDGDETAHGSGAAAVGASPSGAPDGDETAHGSGAAAVGASPSGTPDGGETAGDGEAPTSELPATQPEDDPALAPGERRP